jgi:cytochrome c553
MQRFVEEQNIALYECLPIHLLVSASRRRRSILTQVKTCLPCPQNCPFIRQGGKQMHSGFWSIMLLAAVSAFSGTAQAQQSDAKIYDPGKLEYQTSCAACHGLLGDGKGPFAPALKSRVPSLTTLAKQNGGVFPVARVYGMIDGREQVAGHGPSDMPI